MATTTTRQWKKLKEGWENEKADGILKYRSLSEEIADSLYADEDEEKKMYQSAHRLLSALALPINPRSFPSSFVIVRKIKRSSEATTMMVLQRELKTTSDSLKQMCFIGVPYSDNQRYILPENCDFSLQSMGTNSPKSSLTDYTLPFQPKATLSNLELLLSIYHADTDNFYIVIDSSRNVTLKADKEHVIEELDRVVRVGSSMC
ncbi:hypothetical protein L1887_26854 [Cichorium endivia]|nr:hypothetical protein L1887_26854 [Cichorium endivia]